jgi:predicted dienelactone hydrolase
MRRRPVPVKIYLPAETRGPFPVVLVSHGLGGTREGYAYLGRHLAGHGYVAVHLQHKGSDQEVFLRPQGSLQEKARSAVTLANILNRPLDLRFALKQLERLNREDPILKGRLDLARIGAVGHSFGAFTVLLAAGLGLPNPLGRHVNLADSRIRAVVAMSSPVPPQKWGLPRMYGAIKVPCLHMTGTRDDSPVTGTRAADRRLPFDHMHQHDQYLITFKDGDHLIFSGRPAAMPGGEKDGRFQDLINLAVTAFLDAYLREDQQALDWLRQGGLGQALAGEAQVEMKFPSATPYGPGGEP